MSMPTIRRLLKYPLTSQPIIRKAKNGVKAKQNIGYHNGWVNACTNDFQASKIWICVSGIWHIKPLDGWSYISLGCIESTSVSLKRKKKERKTRMFFSQWKPYMIGWQLVPNAMIIDRNISEMLHNQPWATPKSLMILLKDFGFSYLWRIASQSSRNKVANTAKNETKETAYPKYKFCRIQVSIENVPFLNSSLRYKVTKSYKYAWVSCIKSATVKK